MKHQYLSKLVGEMGGEIMTSWPATIPRPSLTRTVIPLSFRATLQAQAGTPLQALGR